MSWSGHGQTARTSVSSESVPGRTTPRLIVMHFRSSGPIFRVASPERTKVQTTTVACDRGSENIQVLVGQLNYSCQVCLGDCKPSTDRGLVKIYCQSRPGTTYLLTRQYFLTFLPWLHFSSSFCLSVSPRSASSSQQLNQLFYSSDSQSFTVPY
ncbi:hypothetical protein GWI33_003801 [Rhynchophorus ferrugineus]|uniref:Uncharacterized protein n=1 Tax=Rhynchophorus ferrugineus TaxID=354439 RepID=A0A834M0A3_RHYFE|nr:hypothetical protein GWI33_003804 [Rhynchophorus ferrugineus]KAF7262955.1 hypothetical protein GWI33_003801 [Rhynchophorus ferrugineus]